LEFGDVEKKSKANNLEINSWSKAKTKNPDRTNSAHTWHQNEIEPGAHCY